jgi:hypothetical protein
MTVNVTREMAFRTVGYRTKCEGIWIFIFIYLFIYLFIIFFFFELAVVFACCLFNIIKIHPILNLEQWLFACCSCAISTLSNSPKTYSTLLGNALKLPGPRQRKSPSTKMPLAVRLPFAAFADVFFRSTVDGRRLLLLLLGFGFYLVVSCSLFLAASSQRSIRIRIILSTAPCRIGVGWTRLG